MSVVVSLIKKTAVSALDFVFPAACAVCSEWTGSGGEISSVCRRCSAEIKIIADPAGVCRVCGKPPADFFCADAPAGTSFYASRECPQCLSSGSSPPAYKAVRAAAVYDGVLSELIIKFKYQNAERLAGFFASMLFEAYGRYPEISSVDVVAPVPLHWFRRFKRGYNQSALIARGFARMAGLNYRERLLRRAYSTPQQAKLSADERRKNVAGAFRVTPRAVESAKGKKILLIDDVMTTGSTLDACARALIQAGAAAVYCLVVATD